MNNIVIGIDVGGSTTKIVGIRENAGKVDLIQPMFVRATDQITSTYGAFGKFMYDNGLDLSDIDRVMITGAGSSLITKPLYELPCYKVEEFRAIGLGGKYLSGLDTILAASLGTGTALVYVSPDNEPKHIGGTGVGGGTLIGLSKKLLDLDNVDHIQDLAEKGSIDKIDLRIGDIINNSDIPGFTAQTTAANFGNLSELATRADVALGIINMVFEVIGMIALFGARTCNVKNIVLTGNLSMVKQAHEIFERFNMMYDINFMIPENSRFGTVIGAALCGRDENARLINTGK